MNWNSRRITAILSNALLEDQATRDATTLATIDPQQKAMATILVERGLRAGWRRIHTAHF